MQEKSIKISALALSIMVSSLSLLTSNVNAQQANNDTIKVGGAIISNDSNIISKYVPGATSTNYNTGSGSVNVVNIPGMGSTVSFTNTGGAGNNANNNQSVDEQNVKGINKPAVIPLGQQQQQNNINIPPTSKQPIKITDIKNPDDQKSDKNNKIIKAEPPKITLNNTANQNEEKAVTTKSTGQVVIKRDPIIINSISAINKTSLEQMQEVGREQEQQAYRNFLMGRR